MRTVTPCLDLANAARSLVRVAALWLVAATWGCGDSREGGITGPPQDPAPSAPAVRIEIAPGALLLTQTGAAHKLAVRAFDAQGQPTTASVTWRSSSPAVSIGPDGTAVATVPVGSATITAETAGGIRSLPIVVIVAQPKQGALLVSDDQVVGDLLQVDDPEAFGIGWRYQVALRNVSPPSPGTIVLASGGSVVAGKVVSTAASGSDIVVTLEFVPLTELFEALQFSFELPFINDDVPMTGTAALDPHSVPARPTLVEPVGPSFDEVEMEFGPIKCKATAAIPLSLQNTTGSYSGNISGIVQFSFTDGIRLGVTGGISGQMTARPIVEGEWTGDVKCEWNIPTTPWTLPIGGPLAWFYGLQVATGIGVQMKGALELGQVGFDLTANASTQLQMVYECLPPAWICGLQNSLEPTATGTLKPVLPDLADARVKLSGRGYLYGKLQLGPNRRLLQAASFLKPVEKLTVKLAEVNAGIEQTLDVAGPQRQATDPAYASSAELHLNAEVGLDVELKLNWEDFGRKFGYVMQVADVPLWADTIVLSKSPRGTFAASPSSVKAGNDTDLGDLVTFTFDLDPVTYVGAYSVDKVEILWLQPSGGSVILANGRPPCTTLTPTATGQAQFSCQVDFLEEHAGEQTFVGFVYPRLYGIPLPIPFEVRADSRSTVEVTVECPASSQAGGSGFMGAAVESCEEPQVPSCPVPPEDVTPGIFNSSRVDGDTALGQYTFDSLTFEAVSANARTTGTTGSDGLKNWSPDVFLSAGALDHIWIVPLVGDHDWLTVVVHATGRAEAEVIGGTCCGTGTDGTANIEMYGGWFNDQFSPFKVEAGSSFAGNLSRRDEREIDEMGRERVPTDRWWSRGLSIRGRVRHRGADNSAIVRGQFQVTILDVLDDQDRSVPVLICSAAGMNYGVTVADSRAAGNGVAVSRPIRQAVKTARSRR